MVHFCLNSLPSRSVAVLFSERNLNWSASISRAGSFRPTFFRKERLKSIEKMGTIESEVVFEVEIVSAGGIQELAAYSRQTGLHPESVLVYRVFMSFGKVP